MKGLPTRFPSPPLAVQIIALLLGGIVVAQLVTLGLTLLLPPSPPAQHSLADIASGLRGAPVVTEDAKPLLRAADDQPPSLQSPGWFVSESAHADLARLLNARPDDVRLLFYAPLPFAGPPTRRMTRQDAAPASGPAHDLANVLRAVIAPSAEAQPPAPRPFVPPPAGLPQRLPPGAAPALSASINGARGPLGGPPAGRGSAAMGWPGANTARPPVWASRFPPASPGIRPGSAVGIRPGAQGGLPPSGGLSRATMVMPLPGLIAPTASGFPRPGLPGAPMGRPMMGPDLGGIGRVPDTGMMRTFGVRSGGLTTSVSVSATLPARPRPDEAPQSPVPEVSALRSDTVQAPGPLHAPAAPATDAVALAPTIAAKAAAKAAMPQADPGRTVAKPQARGLFGIAPAPYIEGDFIAAYRVAPNRWVTLRTQPEGFPNAWQKRVMLWFAISFAIVAPLGWIFARRLARPLGDFARAAERLGRQPTAEVLAQEGPAEVGQAARAFNQMQARLRRYVEDRTGMIGAISHDLRTPLARLRFRIERASPTLRREMARDLDQMEAMITSVLTFMRDNAEPGERQRVDLRSIVECAVDDAEVVGAAVSLEPGAPAEVEVDVLSVQRVFANLIDNAIKYGEQAQVRLFPEQNEIVAEISDRGPGLADSDLDRVFLPFYRSAEARNSTLQGVGLGLSTSRSTIRAHGGDIRLRRGQTGLVAQVRLPLATRTAS